MNRIIERPMQWGEGRWDDLLDWAGRHGPLDSWVFGYSKHGVVALESAILRDVVRPAYIILAAVHLVIWLVLRVSLWAAAKRGDAPSSRQLAMGRFMLAKFLMWTVFWIRSENVMNVAPVWDNLLVILVLMAVLGTAVDVMVRYFLFFVWRPMRTARPEHRHVLRDVPRDDLG